MAKEEIRDESNAADDAKLPKRDRTGVAERNQDRRRADYPDSFALNNPNRPSHPDGYRNNR